jgi:hypothetical protein
MQLLSQTISCFYVLIGYKIKKNNYFLPCGAKGKSKSIRGIQIALFPAGLSVSFSVCRLADGCITDGFCAKEPVICIFLVKYIIISNY